MTTFYIIFVIVIAMGGMYWINDAIDKFIKKKFLDAILCTLSAVASIMCCVVIIKENIEKSEFSSKEYKLEYKITVQGESSDTTYVLTQK